MLAKICPKCHSTSVHRSKRRNLADYAVILLLRRPYRCRVCRHRFLQYVFAKRVHTHDGEPDAAPFIRQEEGDSDEVGARSH